MTDAIRWTRQTDGTYLKTGELPDVRRVQMFIPGRPRPWGSYSILEATEIIEGAIAKGQVREDVYMIVPAPKQSEDEVERLQTFTEKRKQAKKKAQEEAAADDATAHEELQEKGLENRAEKNKDGRTDGKSGSIAMHVRWHVKRGTTNPNCRYCQIEQREE